MKLGSLEQQPTERMSWSINYGEALNAGDSVVSATATCEPEGLIVENVEPFDEGTRVRFWVRGGVGRTNYKITLRVQTADGERLEDEVTAKIVEV